MSEIAIRVENLSKQYKIGAVKHRHNTLRDQLADGLTALVRRNGQAYPSKDTIWALKDVSFEIREGEVVGVIGRNGAGKSTLLKILSRITAPTSGYARIHGRVGSLLEVGAGFHFELTGRENIYLNGAILGMKRVEIDRKFDEIVAFAEMEEFIDTPVKRYSSGMYMRLAFAVAAHLEPEILLVDEVLAVGDAAFQKKCLGRIGDVANEGRTVLFVSHNMTAILGLCQRVIVLDDGHVIADDFSRTSVDKYLQSIEKRAYLPLVERLDREGSQIFKFVAFELRNIDGLPLQYFYSGQDAVIAITYQSNTCRILRNVHIAIGVHGRFDEHLFHLSTSVNGFDFDRIPESGTILCKIPHLPLQPGRYNFNLYCTVAGGIADWVQNAGIIEVEAGDFFSTGRLPPPNQGPFMVQHSWSIYLTEGLRHEVSQS
jgi:lipopolysaccharide transport system ATP-binding protein